MSFEKSHIHFSRNETTILNLKIGRCVTTDLNEKILLQQIIEESYDVCRLTVSASDEYVSSKLDRIGLPYFYSGSITRYKTLMANLPERAFLHPNLEYENYDGSQDELLLQLLIGTWGDNPIGYYRSPILRHLINKEEEIISVFEFYRKFNLQKNFPNNTIMFMKINNEYVGFFALNIIEDRLESHIGGILAPYRNDGYFFDMQEYIRRFCLKNQLKYFQFGARNENLRVNGIFKKFGYDSIGTDIIFHIVPLLSFSSRENLTYETLEINDSDSTAFHSAFLNVAFRIVKEKACLSNYIYSFKVTPFKSLSIGTFQLTITMPIVDSNELYLIMMLIDKERQLSCIAYFHAYD